MKKETVSSRLRKNILEVMPKGESYGIPSMKQQLELQRNMRYGVDYQESHLAGVLSVLVKKNILESPERGVYKIKEQEEELSEENDVLMAAQALSLQEIKNEMLVMAGKEYKMIDRMIERIDLQELVSKDTDDLRCILECKEMWNEICQKLQ